MMKATSEQRKSVDDEVPFFYKWMNVLFTAAVHFFYSTISVVGLEKFPKKYTPTILAFNHGNGLVDAALLMSHTPRPLRFCAKDTLWNLPFWGVFVS